MTNGSRNKNTRNQVLIITFNWCLMLISAAGIWGIILNELLKPTAHNIPVFSYVMMFLVSLLVVFLGYCCLNFPVWIYCKLTKSNFDNIFCEFGFNEKSEKNEYVNELNCNSLDRTRINPMEKSHSKFMENNAFDKREFLEQVEGKKFGEFILYKDKRMDMRLVQQAIIGLTSLFDDDTIMELIDSINELGVTDGSIFLQSCDTVYSTLESELQNFDFEEELSDIDVFELFEIISLNIVYGLKQNPQYRSMLEKLIYPN